MKQAIALSAMAVVVVLAVAAAHYSGPVNQDPGYYLFNDRRGLSGIGNFYNVVTNLPFLLIGVIGVKRLLSGELSIIRQFMPAYLLLFTGVFLAGLGSAYFHLWPNHQTLVWDRLAIAIVFMSLFSIIIAEFISLKVAKTVFWPLLVFGIYSVVYWKISESSGQGDLRPYALVQYLPVLLMPIILLGYRAKFSHHSVYWLVWWCYLAAKVFEHLDGQIYHQLGFISGHSLKHLIAALGIWLLVSAYTKRTAIS